MRKHLRTLLWLLAFATLFPFLYPWQDGKPLLTWSDIRMPAVALPAVTVAGREAHQPVTLYRWQGSDGAMAFSSEPPPPGVAYEVVAVDPDANLLEAPPARIEHGENSGEEGVGTATIRALPSPLSVSPGEARQLVQDAYKLREMSEERLRQQEALAR